MTTIVANLECMAADTRVSVDGAPHYHANKIFRIGESLFGTAGDGMMCLVMVEWLKGKRNRLDLYKQWTDHTERSSCWILELNPEGLYLWDGWGIPEKLNEVRYSIGSGAQSAMRAIDDGHSPEDAVKGSTNYDQYTGAPIHVEYLLPKELLAKPKRKRG